MSAQKLLSLDVEDAVSCVGHSLWVAISAARQADPAFRLTESTLTHCLRAVWPKEPAKAVRINGGRNPMFDALATGCALEEPFTASARGQIAKAMNEIVKAFPAVDAAEMTRVAVAVRKKYENCGPMGVSAHFGEFVRRHRKPLAASAPVGWLAKLNELYPHSTLAKGGAFEIERETEYQWKQLDVAIQDAIRKALT